ncbi:MAG: hypothetical protein U5L46_07945 [Agrobacterium sp.]|nr:hypothetical protein [Agrobacterium sp.]
MTCYRQQQADLSTMNMPSDPASETSVNIEEAQRCGHHGLNSIGCSLLTGRLRRSPANARSISLVANDGFP